VTAARIERSRLDEKREKARADARTWLDVCRAVNQRDGFTCRCCGRKCVQTLTVQENRLEHHHVLPKSMGGKDTTANVAILCLACHDVRHVKRTLHISGNADAVLTFEQNGMTWRG
jgi:hypothetical protein